MGKLRVFVFVQIDRENNMLAVQLPVALIQCLTLLIISAECSNMLTTHGGSLVKSHKYQRALDPVPVPGWTLSLMTYRGDDRNRTWTNLPSVPEFTNDTGRYVLFCLRLPNVADKQQSSLETGGIHELSTAPNGTSVMLSQIVPWINSTYYVVTEPTTGFGFEIETCPFSMCSSRRWC